MLVLGRKQNEKIIINGNISVTVLKIERGKVRLGIKVPKEVVVLRQELLQTEPVDTTGTPAA